MEKETLSRSERNKKIYDDVYHSDNFHDNEEHYEIEKDHLIENINNDASEVLSREVYHKNKEYSRFFDDVDDELKTIEQKLEFTSVTDFEEVNRDLKDLILKAKKQRGNEDKNTQYNILSKLELDETQKDLAQSEFFKTNELVSLKQGINDLEELIHDIESHTQEHTFSNEKPLTQEELEFTFNLEKVVEQTSSGFSLGSIDTSETNRFEDDLKLNLSDYMNEEDEVEENFFQKNEQFMQILVIAVVILFVVVAAWALKDLLIK